MGFGNSFLDAFENTDVAKDIAENEARIAAEKKARVAAEGENLARPRAIEADTKARRENQARVIAEAKRAEQLALYRGQRAQRGTGGNSEQEKLSEIEAKVAARRRAHAVSLYGEDSPQAKAYDIPAQPPTAGTPKTIYSEQAAQAAGAPQFGEIMPLTGGQVRGLQGVSLRGLMTPPAPPPAPGGGPQTPVAPLPPGPGRTRTARPER